MGSDPQSSPSDPDVPDDRARGEAADVRDRMADVRDRMADERERTADERERTADERDATADEREEDADARERRIAEWEAKVDARERAAGGAAPSPRQRSYEQIDRVQKLLTASHARLDRSESALRRADAGDAREQDAVDREAAASASRHAADNAPTRDFLEARVVRVQQRAAKALDTLSSAQGRLARAHEEHARPREAAEHLRLAELAREMAETLRAALETDDGQAAG
ncbi:hypothetical protein AB0933_15290 [Streptomyces venezuelae]|uniref:hypothetical protein n=1 Tax=Streptomyces venezuelae TaxID=54571 RepID=UPI003454E281